MEFNAPLSLKSTYILLAFIAAAYAFGVLAIGSYYTWPDLECVNESRGAYVGVWNAWTQLMISMDGRFTTNVLHAINPMVWGPMELYKLMPMIGLGLFAVALFLLLNTLLISSKQAIVLTLLVVTLHFAVSPGLVFELYSMVYSFMYLWGVTIWIFWLWSLVEFFSASKPRSQDIWMAVSLIFMVLSFGVNEMFLVINALTLGCIFVLAYRNGQLKKAMPIFVTAGITLLFFFSASGSLQRVEYEKEFHNYQHLQTEWKVFLTHLIESWEILLGTGGGLWLLFPVVVGRFELRPNMAEYFKRGLNFGICSVGLFFAAMLAGIPFYIFMGTEGIFPVRIFNVSFSLMQLLILLLAMVFWHGRANESRFFWAASAGVAMFIMFWFGTHNYKRITDEWKSGAYADFDKEYASMHQSLLRIASKESAYKLAVIPEVPHQNLVIYCPTSFSPGMNWENKVLEGFYTIDEVRFQSDSLYKSDFIQQAICK
jgi:hypothetical protein